nr:unnamed protein product [Callosobruchus chinensis]
MSRDDSSGGWVPLGSGGLSNVSVRKRPRPVPPPTTQASNADTNGAATAPAAAAAANAKPKHDYLIFGRRISDDSVSSYFLSSFPQHSETVRNRTTHAPLTSGTLAAVYRPAPLRRRDLACAILAFL